MSSGIQGVTVVVRQQRIREMTLELAVPSGTTPILHSRSRDEAWPYAVKRGGLLAALQKAPSVPTIRDRLVKDTCRRFSDG